MKTLKIQLAEGETLLEIFRSRAENWKPSSVNVRNIEKFNEQQIIVNEIKNKIDGILIDNKMLY